MSAERFTTKTSRLWPLMALTCTALLWSLGGVIFRPLTWHDAPNSDWLIASWRSVYAAMAFLIAFFVARHKGARLVPRLRTSMLVPIVSYAALVLTFVVSTRWTSTAEAVFLQYTAPSFAALILWLCFRRRQNHTDVYAVLLGALGLALLFANQALHHGQGSLLGNFIAVLSGLCFAIYCVFPKAAEDPIAILFYGNLLAGLPALAALWQGFNPPLDVAGSLAVYSILTTVLPFLLFSWASQRCGELSSLLITSMEPVLATAWAVMFFNEKLYALTVAGCLLVFAAAVCNDPVVELFRRVRKS